MPKKAEIAIGGQALIEGVLMRSRNLAGMAVRLPDGKIKTKVEMLKKPSAFWRIPFFRGIYNLISMLVVGIRALNWSASQTAKEEEKPSDFALYVTIIFAFALGVGLFVLLPYVLTFLIGISEDSSPVLFNFVDGLIKIAILLAYVYGISLVGEVKRLYQYHGAEHKVVHCYEKNLPLTINNAKKFPTLHPRCGTSFLFIVIIVGIIVFSFTPLMASLYPDINEIHWAARRAILFFMRILLLPVVAGLSYEFLKWSAKYSSHRVLGVLVMPGLLLQRITTKEPSKKQIEVAIAALRLVAK
ncbi:MAG TPA: DUF1385 domain-containing protein [Candidatus Nanoarchaeia archaeon]|nr:DUF1385 domain-containing protein [Candidatus Nanoarchaeia archaeon]